MKPETFRTLKTFPLHSAFILSLAAITTLTNAPAMANNSGRGMDSTRPPGLMEWPSQDSIVVAPAQKPTILPADISPVRERKTVVRPVQKVVARPAPVAPTGMTNKMSSSMVSIVSGGVSGTYIRIASEMSNVLDEGKRFRILPLVGRGSVQNLRDLLAKDADIAIVQMDAREGLRGEPAYKDAKNNIRYIARLYNEEIHIVAPRHVSNISQLDGKKVNIDLPGSGTNLTARIVFEKLGIKPDFSSIDQSTAFEQLKSGTVQAVVQVAGRPVSSIADLPGDNKFHLLAIPYDDRLSDTYLPARFVSEDYPKLTSEKAVDTIAVGNALVAYNWAPGSERYTQVQRFTDVFFKRFDEFLQPGRHPKWQEVNLTATAPGWKRFKPAQDWLDRNAKTASLAPGVEKDFRRFLELRKDPIVPKNQTERDKLFQDFLGWQRSQEQGQTGALR